MNPNHCGAIAEAAIAEAAIALEAVKRGIPVLRPIFQDARYDLVFDLGCRLAPGAVQMGTSGARG